MVRIENGKIFVVLVPSEVSLRIAVARSSFIR